MTVIQSIRNSFTTKVVSSILALMLLEPITGLKSLYAASGGPTQPEYAGFTAVSASNLVDPFTGNVGYSVPLFEIGGYPVTLSYSGDIGMEQDAGWVGLGWSLNLGSINRGLRGVPDEFDGSDKVQKTESLRPQISVELDLNSVKSEMFPLKNDYKDSVEKSVSGNLKIGYDNYTGLFFGLGGGNKSKDKLNLKKGDDENLNKLNFIPFVSEEAKNRSLNLSRSSAGFQGSLNYDSRTGLGFNADFSNYLNRVKILQQISKYIGIPDNIALNSRSGKVSTGNLYGKVSLFSYTPDFFFNPTFITPVSNMSTYNYSAKIDFSMPTAAKNDRTISINAIVSGAYLSENGGATDIPMYGLIYMKNEHDNFKKIMQYPQNKEFAMFDNHDQVQSLNSNSSELNSSSALADVFSLTGAGVGGSFRLQDNSLILHGPSTQILKASANGLSLSGELGANGIANELGIDVGVILNRQKYESIEAQDFVDEQFKFGQIKNQVNLPYRAVSFKNDFEFIESSNSYYNGFHWDTLAAIGVKNRYSFLEPLTMNFQNKFLSQLMCTTNPETDNYLKFDVNSEIKNEKREARQQVVTYLTAAEANVHGFQKKIVAYPKLNPVGNVGNTTLDFASQEHYFNVLEVDRVGNADFRKQHHISEFTVLQPDGSTYYYGTPVYNYAQYDYDFNVSSSLLFFQKNSEQLNSYNYLNNTVGFFDKDITDNKKGIDHHFTKKRIPAYAHTFLLNAVLSTDYVDKLGDGPTYDDIGNYVKFNYSLFHGDQNSENGFENSGFKWRNIPDENTADLSLGNKSDLQDDKGSFTYGIKELWYIHSIETKDQIALFYLKKRLDGFEVKGPKGGVNFAGKQQYYLDHIKVFSIPEFRKSGEFAVPLKVVHLQYSYDLCKNYSYNIKNTYPNDATKYNPDGLAHPISGVTTDYNQGGKLTLHKIWVTYGSQNIPTTAPYIFEYGTGSSNPDYAYKSMDRWGGYQALLTGSNTIQSKNSGDFPYTSQDPSVTNVNASAWLMNSISLPSGGKIVIEYESDSYGYVQNQKAQNMLNVVGISDNSGYDPNNPTNNELFTNEEKFTFDNPRRVFLIVKKPTGVTDVNQIVNKDELLYYNFLVQLGRDGLDNAAMTKEPINGFCEIESLGEVNSEYSYIKLKHEMAGIWAVNPIVRNALQQGLMRSPFIFNPGSDYFRSSQTSIDNKFMAMLLGSIPEAISMLINKYQYFMTRNFCKRVDLNQCFIRTIAPNNTKYGGGHRVKSVTIFDNWSEMTNAIEGSGSYTVEYDYSGEDGKTSGVASYEPALGGDENPFKYPKTSYRKKVGSKKIKAETKHKERNGIQPSNHSYNLGPICEEYFPSAVVGYGRVTIRTKYPNADINKHKTGYNVQEFYTAKDFPVVSQESILEKRQSRPGKLGINHGQPRKSDSKKLDEELKAKYKWELDVSANLEYTVASQGFKIELNDMHGKPKSNLVYTEGDMVPFSGSKYFYKTNENGELVNIINVIRQTGEVEEVQSGLHIEPILYGSKSSKITHRIQPKIDIDSKGAPPIPIASFHLGYNLNRTSTKAISFTKVIRRSGIIDSVVVYDKGASTSTKNLAWDALTGQVILSSVKNEYSDVVYSLTKPAHWMYKGIQGAYQNIELNVGLNIDNNGEATNTSGLLFPGDELVATDLLNTNKYWVLDRDDINNKISIIDVSGNKPVAGSYTFRVLRSGLKNILGAGAETITLKSIPFKNVNGSLVLNIPVDQVIAGKGITFNDRRRIYERFNVCFEVNCLQPDSGTEPNGNLQSAVLTNFNQCESTVLNYGCLSGGYVYNTKVNPYRMGIKGVWRPFGEYAYHDKRNQYAQRTQSVNSSGYDPNSTNIRVDGLLKNYKEFWYLSSSGWKSRIEADTSNPWTWVETTEHTDELGNNVQSVNALGINSTAIYGYNDRRLAIAKAANAKHQEIISENFEDISTNSKLQFWCQNGISLPLTGSYEFEKDFCGPVRHWPVGQLLLNTGGSVISSNSHTGWKCLKLAKGNNPVMLKDRNIGTNNNSIYKTEYNLSENDFIERFRPIIGKAYIFSMWVKENTRNQCNLQIVDGGTTYSPAIEGKPVIINGWKKLTYRFVPQNSDIHFLFVNNGVPNNANAEVQFCYIDDIRVHPADASMQSYVYDYRNNRLMSTLDDNNFAVYFEYDEEGVLVRKKVETERGILTIDENRKSSKR